MDKAASDEKSPTESLEGFREGLVTLTARLNALRTLQEPRCASQVPILGPLVVAGRRFWNWVSTQWYARPLLEQQNRFNEQTVRALDDLADLLMRLRERQEREEGLLAAGFAAVKNTEHFTLANEPGRMKGLTYHVVMTGVL